MTVATRMTDSRGLAIRLTFPDLTHLRIDHPDLVAAIDAYNRLSAALVNARAEHDRLVQGRAQVVEDDRVALATALTAGKPATDSGALAKYDERIAHQARLVSGHELAVAQAADLVADVLDANRDQFVATLDQALADDSAAMAAAVEAWAKARQHRTQVGDVRRWALAFPDQLRFVQSGTGAIVELLGVNHEPLRTTVVLDALRRDADG